MKKIRFKFLSFILASVFLLSTIVTFNVPSANAITADDLRDISTFIGKFQKLSVQQVKDALAIGESIIVDSETIPDILSDAQKTKLRSLGLTNAQVIEAYTCVLEQLDTDAKVQDLQSGQIDKIIAFINEVETHITQDLKDNLRDKGLTVGDVVQTALDVANLTFDPFENIPEADLEAIFSDNIGIAAATASSYGLNWDNVYALREALSDAEENTLKDIIATMNRTSGGGPSSGGGPGTTSNATTKQITPSSGGTVSLGNEVKLEIPAGALPGTSDVEIKIEKVTSSIPAAPAGFRLLGNVYEVSVNDELHYNFDGSVTLTFTFDPDDLAEGETPVVEYYDEATGSWVSLGGTVSGNTISVTIDHFTKFAVMAQQIEEEPVISLNDITGHWAEGSIKQLVASGAITGYSDGSFKPDNDITRAEFATVLVKAFELAPQSGKVFTDTGKHWAKDFIATAASNGIVKGYDDVTFGPDDLITREQMAVMIVRAAKLDPVSDETVFADAASICDWAKDAVATAVKEGIIKGYPDNTFKPEANATRAEAVTVIVSALK